MQDMAWRDLPQDDKYRKAYRAAKQLAPHGGYVIVGNDGAPLKPARDWQLPSNQLPLDKAMEYWKAWGTNARGIALVANRDFLIFDKDDLERNGFREKLNGSEELVRGLRSETHNLLVGENGVYAERSQSGNGVHYVVGVTEDFHERRGRRVFKDKYNIDIICGPSYCHITGDCISLVKVLEDGTELASRLLDQVERIHPDVGADIERTGPIGYAGLPDGLVWQIIRERCPETWAAISSTGERTLIGDGTFSDAMQRIIGDLAKVSCDPNQVKRMLSRAPIVTCDHLTQKGYGQARSVKFDRVFDDWWYYVGHSEQGNKKGFPIITVAANEWGYPSSDHGSRMYHTWKNAIVGELKNPDALIPMQALAGVSSKSRLAPVANDCRNDTSHPASLTRAQVFQDVGRMFAYFDQFFYVVTRGEPMVHSKYDDGIYKEHNFLKAYKHIRVMCKVSKKGGGSELAEVPAAPMWLNGPDTERYLKVLYSPVGVNEDAPDFIGQGLRNMWQGFGCEIVTDVPGDLAQACPTLFEYFNEVLAGGRFEVVDYLVKWLADAVQNPRRVEQRTAVVLYSEGEGTGKTSFGALASALFHADHTSIVRFEDIDSRFTKRLENKAILVCNEFFMPTQNMRNIDAASVDKFKARIFDLIDHGKMTTERKGVDADEANNYARVVLSSNKAVLLPQGSRARRMFFVKPTEARMGHTAFWDRVYDVIGRRDASRELDRFFTFLADVDLAGFKPQGSKPMTEEMREQLQQAISGMAGLLQRLLDHGELPYVGEPRYIDGDKYYFVQQGDLLRGGGVRGYMAALCKHDILVSAVKFGTDIMTKMSPIPDNQRYTFDDRSVPLAGRWWPELDAAREWFEDKYNNGIKLEWSNDLKEWTIGQHLVQK